MAHHRHVERPVVVQDPHLGAELLRGRGALPRKGLQELGVDGRPLPGELVHLPVQMRGDGRAGRRGWAPGRPARGSARRARARGRSRFGVASLGLETIRCRPESSEGDRACAPRDSRLGSARAHAPPPPPLLPPAARGVRRQPRAAAVLTGRSRRPGRGQRPRSRLGDLARRSDGPDSRGRSRARPTGLDGAGGRAGSPPRRGRPGTGRARCPPTPGLLAARGRWPAGRRAVRHLGVHRRPFAPRPDADPAGRGLRGGGRPSPGSRPDLARRRGAGAGSRAAHRRAARRNGPRRPPPGRQLLLPHCLHRAPELAPGHAGGDDLTGPRLVPDALGRGTARGPVLHPPVGSGAGGPGGGLRCRRGVHRGLQPLGASPGRRRRAAAVPEGEAPAEPLEPARSRSRPTTPRVRPGSSASGS